MKIEGILPHCFIRPDHEIPQAERGSPLLIDTDKNGSSQEVSNLHSDKQKYILPRCSHNTEKLTDESSF